MLSQANALELVTDQLLPLQEAESERLKVVEKWARGEQPDPWQPRNANREHKELMRKAFTPMLGLVVSALSQASYVDGYMAPNSSADAPAWKIWQANGMDSRQIRVHRGAFELGLSYVTVMPGVLRGERMPVVRSYGARRMVATYQDAANDEWPMFALRVEKSGKGRMLFLYDDEVVHTFGIEGDSETPAYIEWRAHEMGVTPVVRMANMIDDDGNCVGEVEPFIPVAARFDQSTFDRLMVQRYSSWKVRTVTGMAKPESKADADRKRLQLSQEDLLVAENPKTNFGTLDETSLEGFIKAGDADLQTLSAVSQTPPQYFPGGMSNLSADALAMAEGTLLRKAGERHMILGEGHEQWLKLAAGWLDVAAPDDAAVKWRDVEARSLAQLADALGKIATMLHFPAQILWEKIPGLTPSDIEKAKELVSQGSSLQQVFDELERMTPPPADANLV